VAFAGIAGAVILAIALRPDATVDVDSRAQAEIAAVEQAPADAVMDPDAEAAWSLVLALASEFDEDDVREVVAPASGAADALINELTDAQRAELAALLQQELGES
jgi:hypothetical protein